MKMKHNYLVLYAIIVLIIILSGCSKNDVVKVDQIEKTDIKNSTKDDSIDEEIYMDELTESNEQVQEKSIFADSESFEERARTAMETLEIWDGSIAESFDGGDGSEDNPYQIRNGAQLAKLAKDVNNGVSFPQTYFVLTSDIALNNVSDWEEYFDTSDWEEYFDSRGIWPEWNSWCPIGYAWQLGYAFEGNFDGNEHIIYGLYSDFCSGGSNGGRNGVSGLFGYVKGNVSNINIAYALIKPHTNIMMESMGGVVGNLSGGSIDNCHGKQIIIEGAWLANNEGVDIGGICGSITDNAEIKNCSMEGIISGSSYDGSSCTGGIVGRASDNSSEIYNCLNKCNITSGDIKSSAAQYVNVGGICGSNRGIMKDCYSSGNIKIFILSELTTVCSGGIAGTSMGNITNCGSSGSISIIYEQEGTALCLGGIAGALGDERNPFTYELPKTEISYCYTNVEMSASKRDRSFNPDGTIKYMYIEMGNENFGGVAGYARGQASIKNCYYNNDYALSAVSTTDSTGNLFTDQTKSLSEAELHNYKNFYNWDFDFEWVIDENLNNGLPIPYSLIRF